MTSARWQILSEYGDGFWDIMCSQIVGQQVAFTRYIKPYLEKLEGCAALPHRAALGCAAGSRAHAPLAGCVASGT